MVDQPRYRSRFNDPGDDDWSDGRSERRSYRRPEPRFEQRLDQWMTAGRQLVDGVAGARPGSRPSARGTGSAAGPRLRPGDLGRWVEDKIDWLLEDDEGWREPWQEPRRPGRETASGAWAGAGSFTADASRSPAYAPLRSSDASPARSSADAPVRPPAAASARNPDAASSRRRPLEAVSLRGTPLLPERPSSLHQAGATPSAAPGRGAVEPAGIEPSRFDAAAVDQDWPDDQSFSVSRWRRGDAPAWTSRESEPGSASSSRSLRSPEPQSPSTAPQPRAMPRSSRRRPG